MNTETTQKYFSNLKEEVDKVYSMANKAKKTGLDPVDSVEVPLAMSMAEKVVGLISTIYPQMQGSGIDTRILDLEKDYGKLDTMIVFQIAEEVAKQKFCKFSSVLEAMDAGIRIGFAYATLGVVSSPIEGYTGIKTRETKDGKEYIEASFAGPIRSAGTTASCVVLMLIDYLRELFGYAKYDPTEEEIKRVWSELSDFHDRITNLQYMPTEEEALFLARNMPIQVAGDPSEKLEVSNHKNLDRVDTNFLRSGFCLIMGEGLAQKAAKGFRLLNGVKEKGIKTSGFDWIKDYIKLHDTRSKDVSGADEDTRPTYIRDLVAGRPIYGHPSRSGGFRFRYGRGRTSGFSGASVHPATMGITDDFIAAGTQLKIEKPTKGCIVTSCDKIDGPIVKLFNGSVRKPTTMEEAKKMYKDVEEIIYIGDFLFPFSDVANRNYDLLKPGYVEEWWALELKDAGFSEKIDCFKVDFQKALELSEEFGISLYPKLIFYWNEISNEQFLDLIDWLKHSIVRKGKIVFQFNSSEQEKFGSAKRALELLGVEHEVTTENVVLDEELSSVLLVNLGLDINFLKKDEFLLKDSILELSLKLGQGKSVFELVNSLSEFDIRDKSGDFVGTRMGRPEKGKLRKLQGSPNVLFPVGNEGGRLKSVQTACEIGKVKSNFPLLYCEKCDQETIYRRCEVCNELTKKKFYFSETKEKFFEKEREGYERMGTPYCYQNLDINHFFDKARSSLNLSKAEIPLLIKGVKGVTSKDKVMENLAKGILRAKYELQVNKDGTIRFDVTEMPLISFKPKEARVSIEKLRVLGYCKDIYGKELVGEDQILDLMPHDLLLPSAKESPDERADDVFFKVSKFVDEELERFYGIAPFHNLKSKEDLVGQLGVFMAPHNCAGVVCRFIGFSNTQGVLASPYLHAAVRRDCDGDESSIMLLSDVLLNFSRKFLPGHRGGTQDAPLVLNAKIDAGEVDDQILDFEATPEETYPLELYEKAEKRLHSSEVKEIVIIKNLLKGGKDPFVQLGFTHDTDNINDGVIVSAYKTLPTMQEKVKHQMGLVEKLRAADTSDTVRLILERHFIRDLKGNLRGFSMQAFRCVGCNESIRRPPLNGVCPKCRGKVIFTVHEGGIKKYLEPAINLSYKYNLSPYVKQSIDLVKRYIESVFGKELEKQETLEGFFHSKQN